MNGRLYAKHRLIGTRVEKPLGRVRWMLKTPARMKHPELWAMHLESSYIDEALDHLLQPGWSCIDGGCHIGSTLSKFVGKSPGGHHLAIEPVPSKAAWLRNRYPNVDVQQVALSDQNGTLTFYEDSKRPGFSSLRPPDSSSDILSYDTDVRLLDDLVGDRAFDFVKLDLEGAELPALRGATALIERCHPAMLFECGVQTGLDAFGYERVDLWDFLVGTGYDVYLALDFVFGREPMSRDEFRRAGTYPFPGFNYFAIPAGTPIKRLRQ